MSAQPFEITISSDRIIRGDLFQAQTTAPKGILIICHGFKGFKDWGMFPYVAKQFSSQYHVITFNFSHNGVGADLHSFSELDKFAINTYQLDLEDLNDVIEALKKGDLPLQADTSLPLILLGHSRGAAVSLIYSFDFPERISAVLSWNGITHVDLLTQEQKVEMRHRGYTTIANARTKQDMPLNRIILEDMEAQSARYNIIERVKHAQHPIILVQGDEDYERLIRGSERLISALPAVRWIKIKGGSHTFNTVHPFQGSTGALDEAIEQSLQQLNTLL
jgi:pimeloyl-ACP methyl ester carboxylesterase